VYHQILAPGRLGVVRRPGAQEATMGEGAIRTGERRPIAARDWPIFQRLARALAARRVTPNAISVSSMVAGCAAGLALAATAHASGWVGRLAWLAAALFVQLRLLANMLDGMVAVEGGMASPVGPLYNEVPDRVSDAAVFIGAGYAQGGDVTLGYLAACVALFVAYVRAQGKAAGAPNDFCGPMAKQQRMFVVTAVALYCGLAPADWQPQGDAGRGVLAVGLLLVIVLGLATALRRLRRSAAALRKAAA
jgi:phosphatidylglycerophosphate synthase